MSSRVPATPLSIFLAGLLIITTLLLVPLSVFGQESNTLSGAIARTYILELNDISDLEAFRALARPSGQKGANNADTNSSISDGMMDSMSDNVQQSKDGEHRRRAPRRRRSFSFWKRGQADDAAGSTDSARTPPYYFSIRQEFVNKQLFMGLSVTLDNAEDLPLISRMHGVKSITPVRYVRPPQPYANKVTLASHPSTRQLSDTFSTHIMTGVDRLHAEGIDGKGVHIAIIDTGVDWTHPSLGGCFGSGCKIATGFDFVGDDYNGGNDPTPDSDPFSQCGPHGTHVSGIVGAQDTRYQFTGVAPAATLGMYRVFGCSGGTADDILMKAFETSFDDGADVISASIGAPAGWVDSPTARMASNIAKLGRAVTVAAGNDGASGMFFPSAPAVGRDVISVGSVDNAYYAVFNATVSTGRDPIQYFSATPLRLSDMPIYATSVDTSVAKDACDDLPEWVPDLAKYLVIVRRGGCSLDIKFRHIADRGGRYALVYNNGLAFSYIEPTNGILKAALISADDGAYLVDQSSNGVEVVLDLPDSMRQDTINKATGGIVSSFTSYGPTFDMSAQTTVSAPGGQVLSLWPVTLGNYSVLSGTSMATPFVAGAAALLIQARKQAGDRNVSQVDVLNRIRSTAVPTFNTTKGTLLETTAKQGGGLLNVFNALHYSSRVFPSSFMLNDTANFVSTRTFNITNGGTTQLSYEIEHAAAGTALTFPKKTIYPNGGPVPLVENSATVGIEPSTMSLEPGETHSVEVKFKQPTGLDSSQLPIYSGYLRVTSSANETLSVNYLGLAASLKSTPMLDTKNGVTRTYSLPAVLVGDTGKVQHLPRAYTFRDGDMPVLQFRLIAGSVMTRVDLVEAASAVAPTLPLNRSDVPAAPSVPAPPGRRFWQTQTRTRRDKVSDKLDETPVPVRIDRLVGPIGAGAYLPRSTMDVANGLYSITWDGTVAGVGDVQSGDYKLLLRTLKIFGDQNNERDWESWLSPVISVTRR